MFQIIKLGLQVIGKSSGGDDWNDAPYEHNAGYPYNNYFKDHVEYPIELKTLYFDFSESNQWIKLPYDDFYNSPYSVEMINRGDIAWIRGDDFNIQARTSYEDFIHIVEEHGGTIYLPKERR